jgi:hypothetical protein
MISSIRLVKVAQKLYLYKKDNGFKWKAKLKEQFSSGVNNDEDLQFFRNKFFELLPYIKSDFDYVDILNLLHKNINEDL